MRNDDDGHLRAAAGVLQQLEDVLARDIVERAGRLVAQQQLRVFRKRPRDGDALLLAAGELRWEILQPILQPDLAQHLCRVERMLAQLRRDLNVFERRQVLDQVIELEHEAHVAAAILRELTAVVAGDVPPVELHGAARERVHTAEDIQQRRLARARRTHDHADLALLDRKARVVQRGDLHLAGLIDFADVFKLHKCHCHHPIPAHFFQFIIPFRARNCNSQNG